MIQRPATYNHIHLTPNTPPPPTLADIERLVDAYGAKMEAYGDFRVDKECWDDYESEREAIRNAHAALMAAIRAYGRE